MPLPGPLVHRQLMDAYARVQKEVEEGRDQILQSRQERDEFDAARTTALMRLAEHYLPELTPETIDNQWGAARRTLEEILRRKQEHTDTCQRSLEHNKNRRQELEAQLLSINERLDELLQQQQTLADQLESRLQADQRFVELADKAAMAEAALERAEANLEEIEQDATRKLPDYEDCDLFQYLYRRGYGTSDYKSRGLTRQIDRWLARHVKFKDSRKSYEFLRRTPVNMRRVLAEDREALETVMQELERRRDQVAEESGLTGTIEQIEHGRKERETALLQLQDILEQTNQLEAEYNQLEHSRGTYYREAVESVRKTLQQMSTRELDEKARATREITDDQIVATIRGIEADREDLDEAVADRNHQTRHETDFLNDLGRIIQQFRAAGFDSARSQFSDSFDVDDEVDRARKAREASQLWRRLRKYQRWAATPNSDPFTGAATHPLAQVLVNAMAHAAGGALANHARRAGRRHRRSFKDFADAFESDVFKFGRRRR